MRVLRIDPQTAETLFQESTGLTTDELFCEFLEGLEFDAACDYAESHRIEA